jgi:hypothetical protein
VRRRRVLGFSMKAIFIKLVYAGSGVDPSRCLHG